METINIGLADNITAIIQHILYMSATTGALTVLAIAFATKGILDVFLKRRLDMEIPVYLRERDKEIIFASSAFLACTYIPVIAVFMMVTGPAELSFYMIGGLAIITFIGYKIFGRRVKDMIQMEGNLTVNSILVILNIIQRNLAAFLQATAIGSINLLLEVVHRLFVYNYAVVAVILNIALTALLINVMGSSNEAGKLNLIGSLIGGIIHYFSVRSKLPELKAKLVKEEEELRKQEEEYDKAHRESKAKSNNRIPVTR